MTDKELLQEALNQLEHYETKPEFNSNINKTIAALRARLAQPEQKPGVWTPVEIGVDVTGAGTHVVGMYVLMPDVVRHVFYSQFHPAPQREWVGLTDDEMMQIYVALKSVAGFYSIEKYARAIEVNLKEKNG